LTDRHRHAGRVIFIDLARALEGSHEYRRAA